MIVLSFELVADAFYRLSGYKAVSSRPRRKIILCVGPNAVSPANTDKVKWLCARARR